MNKILLIIKREYLTRVRNKTFLLSTFLLPLVMVLFIAGSVFFALNGRQKLRLAVSHAPDFFAANLQPDSTRLILDFTAGVDSLNYAERGYDGILYLSGDPGNSSYKLYSKKQVGLETSEYLQRQLNKAVEENLLQERGINRALLDSINAASEKAVDVTNIVTDKAGASKEANAGLAYGIGFGCGILIYITIFIFGAMVMRGVMEEKMSRIAEVIVSSVKPFQLMIGKVIGIAAVGLTQFILWILFILVIVNAASAFLPPELLREAQQVNAHTPGMGQNSTAALQFLQIRSTLQDVNWPLIIGCFLFYFLGGYLFYAALFAAIGSVVNEDPQEAQSLMLPITMPIIFSFIILSSGLQDTNSPMMFWGSMIPFTSPIIMMGRIPAGVPWTEVVLSMLLLTGGFLFTIWLAGKIYRTGILLYGKKASWGEMLKWAFRKS
ncbi:MAG: hypothetical protein RL732_488 [Bacteroidota bacterium]|jgi:ABC-2 type transport system permease protein